MLGIIAGSLRVRGITKHPERAPVRVGLFEFLANYHEGFSYAPELKSLSRTGACSGFFVIPLVLCQIRKLPTHI